LARTTKKPRLCREEWLARALEVLRREGIQGVRVERLARDLGVTKGSFYWHFKDRSDLFGSLLEYWSDRYTGVIVENREFLAGDPRAALLAAMTMVRRERLDQYELAIRAWADSDPAADRACRAVYARRNQFVKGLFERLGFRGLEADVRTRLMLCYMSWEPNMYPDEAEGRRLQLLKIHHELLTQKSV
jgi:AcrR family transcriptional regulator